MSRFWIAQDRFSSGLPAPSFTAHATKEAATSEAAGRLNAEVLEGRECTVCGAVIGLDDRPVIGGCVFCR